MNAVVKNVGFWVAVGACAGALLAVGFSDPAAVGSGGGLAGGMAVLKLVFISVLKAMIGPVVFFSLVTGIIHARHAAGLSQMGLLTVVYYLGTTAIAILIGLVVVLVVHPWESLDLPDPVASLADAPLAAERMVNAEETDAASILAKLGDQLLLDPITAVTRPGVLAVLMYAILVGWLLSIVCAPGGRVVVLVADINRLVGKVLTLAIWLAPVGVMAIVFEFVCKTSGLVFGQLLGFAFVVLLATSVHGLIVLPVLAWRFGGLSPVDFFKRISTPLMVACSTSSSSATLPVTLETCREKLGIRPEVAGFVCPMGATMNMDGTALFEGIAAVFLAHLFGVELSTGGVVAIFIMAMVSSIGVAGMPSGSMSGMQMVLLAVGIPLEAIAILLVVERPLDTFRTAVNVEGDMVGALVVNRYYKQIDHGTHSST